MHAAAPEVSSTGGWGPVRRGFSVSFRGGGRGSVEGIRLRGDGAELLVATGLFVRRLVAVDCGDIEAILPRKRRVIVDPPRRGDADATGVDAAGGIVRMAPRDSWGLGPPGEAA